MTKKSLLLKEKELVEKKMRKKRGGVTRFTCIFIVKLSYILFNIL